MARKKTKTLLVTDEQMADISHYLHNKYPYTYRENVYTATAIVSWELKIDTRFAEEVEGLLQPCEINGFEL